VNPQPGSLFPIDFTPATSCGTALTPVLVTSRLATAAGARAYSGDGPWACSWACLRRPHTFLAPCGSGDASTPQLMERFTANYFRARRRHGPADASSLRRSADPDSVFKNPFYWSPFQLLRRFVSSRPPRGRNKVVPGFGLRFLLKRFPDSGLYSHEASVPETIGLESINYNAMKPAVPVLISGLAATRLLNGRTRRPYV